jgi:hypothetical protein
LKRKVASPSPAPAEASPRIARSLLLGAVGIGLPILLHAVLLPVWGAGSGPLFVVFLLSLLPATAVAFICAGEGILRICYAMCIAIGAPFLSLSLHEARIFGPVPSLEAAAAPAHPSAAGFLMHGAAARADLAREVEARVTVPRQSLRGPSTGSITLRGRFTVVPVVGPDWTPAQPVTVVAVLDHGPDGGIQAVTAAPWGAGRGVLRLLPDPLRDQAVRQALAGAGWTASSNIVVGRWVADPRWARLDAATPLLWLLGVALLAFAVVVLSGHPRIAARLDAALDGPPSAWREIRLGIAALTLPSLLALGLRHAELDAGIAFLALGFALVPSLMITLGSSRATTPIGVLIAGVILVVALPLAVLARGTSPRGDLPSLAGARLADLQEAALVLGAGWLAWAVLVILGRSLGARRPRS